MSRVGKKIIEVPDGVDIQIEAVSPESNKLKVKGPKGELEFVFPNSVSFIQKEKEFSVVPNPKFKKSKAMWGTARAVLNNMVEGVTKGFEKKLELQGTGYKVNLQGKKLVLDVGYSNSVNFEIPAQIEAEVEKNIITVRGIDKQLVGETAALIRKVRKVEPYKGKGIRYVGEYVRRKEGKKAVGESS